MSKQKKAARAVGTKGMPRAEREKLILDAAAQEFGATGRAWVDRCGGGAGGDQQAHDLRVLRVQGRPLPDLPGAHVGSRFVEAVAKAQKGPSDLTRAARTLGGQIPRGLESRVHDWALVYDTTLPADGPLHAAAAVYRQELHRLWSGRCG